MSRPEPKGWCPGALTPMMSGDGLIVRIRPRLGRLAREQALGLCEVAGIYGSGIIEVTSRANIQLRGVALENHAPLVDALNGLGLIDAEAAIEARRNIIVSPLWQAGDETVRIADELAERLGELPELPTKFGFAVDAGTRPVLCGVSADVRVERARCGTLLVRADGASQGKPVTVDTAVDEIVAACRWFIETDGVRARRMAQHLNAIGASACELAGDNSLRPEDCGDASEIGPIAASLRGAIYGVPFGRTSSAALSDLITRTGATGLRVTPWRQLVLEDAEWVEAEAFICDRSDQRGQIYACPGAPFCASATVDVEGLADALSEVATGRVHLSGCSKGCAHAKAAPFTVVGIDDRFDIVSDGRAWDEPAVTGLTSNDVVQFFRDR